MRAPLTEGAVFTREKAMNFDQLRIFMAVVEHGSFTKAAESLYISHSTTSRSVAALEGSLGVSLLRRDNRSVRLTAAGEVLYREGGHLLKRADAVKAAVRDAAMGRAGKLTVAEFGLENSAFSRGLERFCRECPDIALVLLRRELGEIWALVESGEVDVGMCLSFALPENQEGLEVQLVEQSGFCLALPWEDAEPVLRERQLTDVANGGPLYPAAMEEYLHQQGADCKSVVVETVESLFVHLRSGRGAAVLPQPVAKMLGESCRLVILEEAPETVKLVLIWRQDNTNPAVRRLAELF